MDLRQIEKISKALSDVNRLKILQYMQGNQGRIECMEIAGILELAQPSISHHIKKLVEAGLIEPQKTGRFYHYSLNTKIWEAYVQALSHFAAT
ncbi:ArsR/SmtB family transcription factor [Adhaeribacter soli]|uniref:Winged helix-turn-helix transcriptional regulator n=1 Tax=Adhaeribacter soli TaxID=2607655 RepID=A0A5N1INX6_9BACT|nr:metalloregulator ArsR/SmtB family transcription factor [Adhaeribacter soli]KAA9325607.1 winged helix-turn-helix transcriptional regulator [Adhaeribacter soli]